MAITKQTIRAKKAAVNKKAQEEAFSSAPVSVTIAPAHSASTEDEQLEDEEDENNDEDRDDSGEPTVHPKQKAPKSFNFSQEEDERLCEAYLHVSMDAVHGNEQKGDTFWARITEHFKVLMGDDYIARNKRSLPARYDIIKRAVTKYIGFLKSVQASNKSGSNDESDEKQAKLLYKANVGSVFRLKHAYNILHKNQRWIAAFEEARIKKSKGKGKKRAAKFSDEEGDEEEDAAPVGASNRPTMGRKAAKVVAAQELKRNNQFERFIKLQEEILARGEKRAILLERIANATDKMMRSSELSNFTSIMMANPSQIDMPSRRAWLEKLQNDIQVHSSGFSAESTSASSSADVPVVINDESGESNNCAAEIEDLTEENLYD